MFKRVILHVGIHKTGTTSIQGFLGANRDALKAAGVDFYSGLHLADNHVELHIASMNVDRMSPFKMANPFDVDDGYRARVANAVRNFAKASDATRLIFSAEGLSYLRHPKEMDRLRALMPSDDIQIVFYVRDAATFLESYRHEMTTHTLPAVIDRESFAYVADDTWLVDFPMRIGNFQRAFGEDRVTVVDYDDAVRSGGNIIPSFLKAAGIEHVFEPSAYDGYFLHRRVPRP